MVMLLELLRTEEVVVVSAVLDRPVPVGPAVEVVELLMVNRAELLGAEEVVKVLLSEWEAAELEELRADDVVATNDAVGPAVAVPLLVGNMVEELEREELAGLLTLEVLFDEADGIELEEPTTEEVRKLEGDEAEELMLLVD